MPATARSRWRSRSPRCSPPPTCSTTAASDDAADYLRETADAWNDQIERWTYVTEHRALRRRSASTATTCASRRPTSPTRPRRRTASCRSRTGRRATPTRPAAAIVSPDALALVRFGLRAADDPRILDTVKVIDAAAALRPAAGARLVPLQRRRLWRACRRRAVRRHRPRPAVAAAGRRARPLRAGGRAPDEARAACWRRWKPRAGAGGLLPEQVWDGADMPERELHARRPTGSAMPLVWAHAEHIKLLRSLRDGAVFDMPPQGVKRYIEGKTVSPLRSWRFNNKIRTMPAGKTAAHRAAGAARMVHWSSDGWATYPRQPTRPRTPSASISSTCRSAGLPPARPSSSLSSGPTPAVGRMSTSPSQSRPTTRRPGSTPSEPLFRTGTDHADRNDGTGQDGRQHGPPPDARRPSMRRLRHQPRQRRRACRGRRASARASVEEFVGKLTKPRSAWLMLPAAITGAIVEQVAALMEPGDIIIDGGNSNYHDGRRPGGAALAAQGHQLSSMSAPAAASGAWSAAIA